MNRNEQQGAIITERWHLDKKVPLTLIFAMLVQAGIVVWAIADIKKDVEVLKIEVYGLHKSDDKQTDDLRLSLKVLQDQFARMDSKLDRLVERGRP